MGNIDIEWLKATLADAAEELQRAIDRLETDGGEKDAEHIVTHDLVHVYAKLNYAVNTRELGPLALEALTEDELIAWPEIMPFATLDELEAMVDFESKRPRERPRRPRAGVVVSAFPTGGFGQSLASGAGRRSRRRQPKSVMTRK